MQELEPGQATQPGGPRRVQMRSIADRAGVSISTVSRVLSNAGGISQDLQLRVRAAALELGYPLEGVQPQARLRRVSVVTAVGAVGGTADPFYSGVAAGIEAECRRRGVQLSYAMISDSPSSLTALFEKVKAHQLDGLLLLAIDDRSLVEQVLAEGLPTVLLNAEHPDLPIDTVLPDNRRAPLQAVQLLIRQGHRRILYAGMPERPTLRRRLVAYREALMEAGIAYDPALVIGPGSTVASVYSMTSELLATGRADFTAAFCVNDLTAMGVIQALEESGRRIPADVSVIGYDDISIAAMLTPPLTTVRIEREELGATALRQLAERAAFPERPPVWIELGCTLIERSSVGPAAHGV